MKDKVCKSCGYVGKPVKQEAGTFFVDGVIWLAGAGFAAGFSFPPLLLLPVAWTVYHIARYRSVTCPKCGELEMVSLNGHVGQDTLHRFHKHA